MSRLSRKAQEFLTGYSAGFPALAALTAELQAYIAESVRSVPVPLHITTARAKAPASLRRKCRRKSYKNPKLQVTDLMGVRVITYLNQDVEAVAERLRNVLDVSEKKSRDARAELATNEFGYRSVHIVGRLRSPAAAAHRKIGRRWFEIQVRSILDHAWSEIEHEMIYKSGIVYPDRVRRRFNALAGSLEVLEDAFSGLSGERERLIQIYASQYQQAVNLDHSFDVARLEAFLRVERPAGRSWRQAEVEGNPYPHGSEVAALEALQASSLHTARRLSPIFATKQFREALMRFAALESIAPESASHLAVVVIAIASVKPLLLREQFPEMVFSPSVAAAANLS